MTENRPTGEAASTDAAAHVDALSALVARARTGDRAAFEQLMVCTQHKVAATAWRLLGNREDARDAAQETFLRAYKYLKSFKTGQDFHGWLYRITVNVCRDMMRARSASPAGSAAREQRGGEFEAATPWSHAEGGDAERAALLAQQRTIVRRALAALPEKERTAVVLRDLEGLATEEVARLMNTRPATVRSQISTARVKLKVFCEQILREKRPGGSGL
ncbi:MAG TPA: sigma-70 family RNA polymerase sigma factor [Pyrinomonadaceae bacterium]